MPHSTREPARGLRPAISLSFLSSRDIIQPWQTLATAVESKSSPLWLWGPLLAALTGAGGGIFRDVIRSDANNPFLKGTFYAEIALVWRFMLSLFLMWYANLLDYKPSEISPAVVVTLVGALLTRMPAFYLRIKSPMYQ